MTVQDFKATLTQHKAPESFNAVQKALWYDAREQWDTAHDLIQDDDRGDGAWVHAYLHRKEGDEFNAQYWYRRAGKSMPQGSLQEEWEQMVQQLAAAL